MPFSIPLPRKRRSNLESIKNPPFPHIFIPCLHPRSTARTISRLWRYRSQTCLKSQSMSNFIYLSSTKIEQNKNQSLSGHVQKSIKGGGRLQVRYETIYMYSVYNTFKNINTMQ